ncbi:hypothetical protein EST35_0043 [Pseudomonas phage vB_PaeM_PA5oct]|uniref:Uncharacterized protein n=1 Tax=Pseudomonas phage vB_PaeM_PA5oct TaxID=2163605 RepID=A0A4Y5JT51_9CAUD|nr:hypothetical protein PQE65_gp439 [Pseudomonas phage vB_PaeM_PA5oct]QCG75926.1 hypothetical protein EST35_0043 [Pseudomonas phage vB_PaeM_PA5oct]
MIVLKRYIRLHSIYRLSYYAHNIHFSKTKKIMLYVGNAGPVPVT